MKKRKPPKYWNLEDPTKTIFEKIQFWLNSGVKINVV